MVLSNQYNISIVTKKSIIWEHKNKLRLPIMNTNGHEVLAIIKCWIYRVLLPIQKLKVFNVLSQYRSAQIIQRLTNYISAMLKSD